MTTLDETAAAAAAPHHEALGAAATREWARRGRDARARVRVAHTWVAARLRHGGNRAVAAAKAKTAGARTAASPATYRPMSIAELRTFIKGGSGKAGAARPGPLERTHDFYMRYVAIPATFALNAAEWFVQRPLRAAGAAAVLVVLYGI